LGEKDDIVGIRFLLEGGLCQSVIVCQNRVDKIVASLLSFSEIRNAKHCVRIKLSKEQQE
jgi:hypothetical protein